MTRPITFTQAQITRAIRAAEKAGLKVTGFTVRPDGSIRVESGETPLATIDAHKVPLAASWDDL